MHLDSLQAENFRNFSAVRLSFAKHTNLVIGSNGSGKSNLLELIYFAMFSKSNRTSEDLNLIKWKEDYLRTQITFQKDGLDKTVVVSVNKEKEKKILLNNLPEKFSVLFREGTLIVFSPSTSQLVKGLPNIRRKWLDRIMVRADREYSSVVFSYQQTLRNRKALLKRKLIQKEDYDLYDLLTTNLISLSSLIRKGRTELIKLINAMITPTLSKMELPMFSSLTLKYYPSRMIEDLSLLAKEEIKRGVTLIGSHLDGLEVFHGDVSVRDFSSEGEQKLISFALKLCEFETIQLKTKNTPVCLIDDLFSELDEDRANLLFQYVSSVSQTIFTDLTGKSIQADNTITLHKEQSEVCSL